MDTRPAITRSTPAGSSPSTGPVSIGTADGPVRPAVGGLHRLLRRLGALRARGRGRWRPAVPPEGRWVAAAVTDDLDAVEVVRVARGHAVEGDGRLLLLVPQPAGGFTTEPMVSVMMQRWREEAALAIVGRVLPVLEESAAPLREVRTQVVPHGSVSWRVDGRTVGWGPGPSGGPCCRRPAVPARTSWWPPRRCFPAGPLTAAPCSWTWTRAG